LDPTGVKTFVTTTKNRVFAVGLAFAMGMLNVAQANPGEAQLMKEARVTKSQAEKTALMKVPNGIIMSAEIEKEHGRLIWSFDIAKQGTKNITEVQVNAINGNIVSLQIETPKDQATEVAVDRAKK
jgi:uncharacterized membrane protein YkoI